MSRCAENDYQYVIPKSTGNSVSFDGIEEQKARASYQEWMRNRQHGLAVTLHRIQQLMETYVLEAEAEDIDATHMFWNTSSEAKKLLRAAYHKMDDFFPHAYASVDWEGRTRLEWKYGNKEVRLVVAPSNKGYIYCQEGKLKGDVSKDVTAVELAKYLNWLVN